MWEQFVANPSQNGVRQLAERYGLSIKRVDAILRLKGLEQHWIKVCVCAMRLSNLYRDEFKSISL